MRSAIACTVILAIALGCHSKGAKDSSSTAVVRDGTNSVLSVANFVRIQEFILGQGRRQTYCQAFNNNPVWFFAEFRAYLNPTDQRNINCEIGKSDFPVLVIVVSIRGGNRYWDFYLDRPTKELRVSQNYSKIEPTVLVREVSEFFRKALAEIDKQAVSRIPNEVDAGDARISRP